MSCLQKWKTVIAMIIVEFGFAAVNALFKKVLNGGMDQLVASTYRLAVSAIFLAPLAWFFERNVTSKLTARIICSLFISALLGGTLTQYFFLLGLEYTSTTFSCAFLNMVPVITFILALLLRQETIKIKSRSGRAKILGIIFCLGGALILTLYKGMSLINPSAGSRIETNHNKKSWFLGSIFLFAGCFVWSAWFLVQARISKDYPYQYSSTAIMSFFGAFQSAILSFIISRNVSKWILKGGLEILSVIFGGMVGSGLCYVVMSWCVKQKGAVFTSAFSPLIQIFAAVFDISILHAQIHLGSILGSILVVIGLYFLLWGKSKEAEIYKNPPPTEKNGQSALPVTASPTHI
ncbi:WAT1-related protein At3g30340-like [Nicotiana tabacum]|uniref:WAT1-related protein n=2 Tax=Nicotiana TaxID=4085 RepID=A0A1S4CEU8_TOBAC|nr:PREDICTED: WAT1-related protein At3g30340-like [Nicotiana sylvestris]XP_016499685.1 PREDICTED: WAT1-related protein At3g30340-like [Nicotiana tabacum]